MRIIDENEKYVKIETYIWRSNSLDEVVHELEEQFNSSVGQRFLDYTMVDLKVSSGLPKLDHGQTVTARFMKNDYPKTLKDRSPKYEGRIVFGL